MYESRIQAIDHVHLEAPPGVVEALRRFYREVTMLEEARSAAADGGTVVFRSGRIELRFRLTVRPRIEPERCRLTVAVPSLEEAIERLRHLHRPVVLLRGLCWSERQLRTRDPAGHLVALKRQWSYAPL